MNKNKKPKGTVKSSKVPCAVEQDVLKKQLLSDCKTEEKPKKSMGIGPLGSPDLIFSRKFRWTLEGQHLPAHFVKNVKFDYVNKKITFEYYDVATSTDGFHALVWADHLGKRKLPDETLTFSTYDGCGVELDRQIFKGLKLLAHYCDFDYASSDEATQNIVVSYEYINIELLVCPSPIKNYEWKMHFEDEDGRQLTPQSMVLLTERPNLSLEETEINHLNAKLFLPGKARWEHVKVVASKEVRVHVAKLSAALAERNTEIPRHTAVLTYCENGEDVEQWRLKAVWVLNANFGEKECEFKLHHSGVEYRNLVAERQGYKDADSH